MFTVEEIDSLFERFADTERYHAHNYYRELEMLKTEEDLERRKVIEEEMLKEMCHFESFQFAQGVITNLMKEKNLWDGSRSAEKDTEMMKWRMRNYEKAFREDK